MIKNCITWYCRCEVEEYVTWRSSHAGRIQTAVMNVTVKTPRLKSLPTSNDTPLTPAKPNTTILQPKGFRITKAEPTLVVANPGDSVTLLCAVDDYYRECKWFHPGGEFCTFEWKRSEDNITMQECALHDRISFYGNYNLMECGISFTAQQQDTGLWREVPQVWKDEQQKLINRVYIFAE